MCLKIFSIIALSLQVLLQLIQSLARAKLREEGRREMNDENKKIIEDEVDAANIIRSNSSRLADDLLLKPEQRNSSGLPAVSADIRGNAAGSSDVDAIPSEREIKSAQQDLGKQLSAASFKIPKRKINKVFIHCSASDRAEDDNVKTINAWHLARGWSEIGYNYYIDKKGILWSGRELEKIPAAQKGYNAGSIAICCGGKNSFTAAQFFNLHGFCQAIAREFLRAGVKISFHGHCEVSSKTCPDFDYKSVLGLDTKGFMTWFNCGNQH